MDLVGEMAYEMHKRENMKFCPNCSHKIAKNEHNFCVNCGHTLVPKNEATVPAPEQTKPVGFFQSKRNLLIIGGIVIILIALLLGGVILFLIMNNNSQKLASPSNLAQVNQEKSQNLQLPAITNQGCQYNSPPCSSDYECLNNQCILKRGCQYNNPACQYNQDCINNICVLKQCPYECCDDIEYQRKDCQTDYACLNHACKPIDSDGDGLYDYEEKQLGTNPNLADSDGDTLSDYQEVRVLHTNPLNPNTDGDRYNDNVDPNPLTKNTASVAITKTNEKGDYDYPTMGLLVVSLAGSTITGCFTSGCTLTAPLLASVLATLGLTQSVIYHDNMDLYISNSGTDYTNYVNYNVNYYVDNKLVLSQKESTGRLEAGSSITKHYTYDIKAIDVPGALIRLLNSKPIIEKRVEDIKYEQYT